LNFYPHHIGDYLTATAHLTWQEDCAYRRLLDVYYSREQALPTEMAQACRLVRASSKEEKKAVETVLNEFFVLIDSGWSHSRCEEEIVKARDAAERARVNGKKGGRPPKQKPTANPEITQPVSVANPEISKSQAPITNPITNTSYSVPNGTDAAEAPSGMTEPESRKAEAWKGIKSMLNAHGMPKAQTGPFVGKLATDYGQDIALEAMEAAIVQRPAEPDSWLKATCQHLAGQRQRNEPAWRAEQRERTAQAAPGVATHQISADKFFIDVEARNVAPRLVG